MKVDGSLKSLVQGVSQQPDVNRLPGQCTEQINCSSNPVDGLVRRAPTVEIANLFTTSDAPQFYNFNVNDTEYIAAATIDGLKVFTEAGVEKTVNENNDAFDYLDGNGLGFSTSNDITYVNNRSTVALMKAEVATYATGVGLVYLLGGNYGKAYSINIAFDGGTLSVSYTTPNGSVATDINAIATDAIAGALASALNANSTFTSNFTLARVSDVILIHRNNETRFTITSGDGNGGIDMYSVTDHLQDASKLPVFASNGHVIQVTGTGDSQADNWYAEFQTDLKPDGTSYAIGAGFGTPGKWIEVVAPNINYKILSTTMPHILTYDVDTDEFTFDLAGFANRAAGDYTTNADPSFIGATIEDVSFFQGRLVFLSGNNIIMSRTNKPFDFWKNSATTQADSDPIDEHSTAKGVKKLYRAIPFNRDLIVFSNKGQFIFFGRNAVTPKNSSLVLTTTFEAAISDKSIIGDFTGATPVPAGRNIFFAQNYGTNTGIREFFADGALDVNDARTITLQVLKYIKGKVKLLSTSQNFDILLVHADADPKTVYIYEYIWENNQKIQSSWSKWEFAMDVVYSYINQSVVTFIQKSGTTYIMSKMDLNILDDEAVTYQIKLDRKKTATSVHTTLANPYMTMPDPANIIFVQGDDCPNPGLRCFVKSYNSGTNTYTFTRDMLGGTVWYGIPYRSSYIPTNPRVKDSDGVTVNTGKLRVTKYLVTYTNTGVINARVISKYAPDEETRFIGRVVGDLNSTVGNPAIVSGKLNVPFRSNVNYAHIEFWSDDFSPMSFNEIEWTGQYNKKGQRITNSGRR